MIGLQAAVMTSMHDTVKALILEQGIDVPTAISFVTRNVAKALELDARKGSIRAGSDADILLLDEALTVETVLAKGRVMMRNGEILVKGTFE